MYNGIGLQTPRGSGTNGYVQTNKFLIRGRTSKVVVDGDKGFAPDQGMGGISKKANKEILEHDRKRQIELKLVILEDKLSEQGYTDAEISEKCEELRSKLEAEAATTGDGYGGAVGISDKKVSDTETHQIAARKEKQMEKLRDALGISDDAAKQGNINDIDVDNDDDKPNNIRKDDLDGESSEREEGEIWHGDENVKNVKHYQDEDELRNHGKKTKKEENRKRHDSDSSDSKSTDKSSGSGTDSDREAKRKQTSMRLSKKKVSGKSHDSDSDSDQSYRGRQKDVGRSSKVPKKNILDKKHDFDSDNDDPYRGRQKDVGRSSKVSKTHDPSSESDHSDMSPGHRNMMSKQHLASNRSRHDSGNEHAIASHKRDVSDRENVLTESRRSKRNDSNRYDHGKKHEDKYYKSSDTSGQLQSL
ncbi:Serine/arginine repetitive matrix protein 2 [Bienertia sinuspersici]